MPQVRDDSPPGRRYRDEYFWSLYPIRSWYGNPNPSFDFLTFLTYLLILRRSSWKTENVIGYRCLNDTHGENTHPTFTRRQCRLSHQRLHRKKTYRETTVSASSRKYRRVNQGHQLTSKQTGRVWWDIFDNHTDAFSTSRSCEQMVLANLHVRNLPITRRKGAELDRNRHNSQNPPWPMSRVWRGRVFKKKKKPGGSLRMALSYSCTRIQKNQRHEWFWRLVSRKALTICTLICGNGWRRMITFN